MKKIVWLGILVAACSRDSVQVSDRFTPLTNGTYSQLVAVTGSYAGGSVGELVSLKLHEGKVLTAKQSIGNDAWVRVFPSNPNWYVVNRFGGENIQIFSPETMSQVSQTSFGEEKEVVTGPSGEMALTPNLQDILVTSQGTFLTALNAKSLFEIDLNAGRVVSKIDMKDYADGDGFAELSLMHEHQGQILIQAQRLDAGTTRENQIWLPTEHSSILKMDPKTRAVSEIKLVWKNPMPDYRTDASGNLYVATVGNRAELTDGGIEKLDVTLGTSQSTGITEELFKATVSDFVMTLKGAWVIVTKADWSNHLVRRVSDLSQPNEEILSTGGPLQQIQALAYDAERGLVFVGVTEQGQPKVKIYQDSDKTLVQEVPLHLPITQLELVK